MYNLILKLIPIVLSIMLSACASYVFGPPAYPQDYWKKKGYSEKMVEVVDIGCGTNVYSNSLCMLERGFIFLDPNKTCQETRNQNYLPCKFKDKGFPMQKLVADCYESKEVITKRTCNGIHINTQIFNSDSQPYDPIIDFPERSIQLQQEVQKESNRQMDKLLHDTAPKLHK